MAELDGRVAWVTGAGGALVCLSGRNRDSLAAVAAEIEGSRVIPADLASRAEVDGAAREILAAHGRIDILVNSTALPVFGAFLELDDDDWERVLQAKLMGYVRTMRAVIPSMVERRFGRIVNVSGRGGRQPTPAHLPGCAANAAVNLLCKGIADIYGKDNIRVNAVAPGPIDTPRLTTIASSNDALAKQGQSAARPANAPTPLGRLGTPQDIANAVAYLVSERSAFVTGTVHAVDGGGTAAL